MALSRLTALEVARQPICLLLTTSAVVMTALVPLLALHVFGEEGKLVRNSGFAIHFVFGLFLTGYAATTALARERRTGTGAAVLSKPVSRERFFLAKYAGIAGVIVFFSAAASVATLLSERVAERFIFTDTRVGYWTDWQTGYLLLATPLLALFLAGAINYLTKRPFGSWAFGLLLAALFGVLWLVGCFDRYGNWAPFDFRVAWRLLPVSGLITVALLVLGSLALALSARLRPVPTLTLCVVVFLLGLMSDYLVGRHAATHPLAALLYRVLPNWQHFWVSDALNDGGTVAVAYIGQAIGYAAAYTAGTLCLGVAAFRNAETP